MPWKMLALAGVLSMLPPIAAAAQDAPGTVSGTVAYRERIALPPDAIVRVRLEDVSLADAKAKEIARTKITLNGKQVPIAFTIHYPKHAIDSGHTYSVRATISIKDTVRWTSTQSYPVLTRGAPSKVDVMVHQVGSKPAPHPVPPVDMHLKPPASLQNTYWKLIELKGAPVQVAEHGTEPNMTLRAEGKLTGSGGCNRFTGTYVITAKGGVTLDPGATTMMACVEPYMSQEGAVFAALRSVTRYEISGDDLTLRAGEEIVARFVAVYMR